MRGIGWVASATALAVLGAACSSGSDGAVSVDEYLAEVERVELIRAEPLAALEDTLAQGYQTRERFFDAVRELVDTGALEESRDQGREVEPPEELRDEHERWLVTLDAGADFAAEAARAVERDDLTAFSTAAAEVLATFGTFVAGTSEEMCRAAVQEFAGGDDFCDADVPGGDYGRALRSAALRMPAEIGPRITGLQAAFTDDELIRYIDAIQPPVERTFREVLDALAALDPPDDLSADHAAVTAYFAGLLDVAERITTASLDRDVEALERLFLESAEPGRVLEEALGATGREIVGFLVEE